jgi:hypothetical protein
MTRSLGEVPQHAGELAGGPAVRARASRRPCPGAVTLLRAAIHGRSRPERHRIDAIRSARRSGMSWSTIGTFVDTGGEAARQR